MYYTRTMHNAQCTIRNAYYQVPGTALANNRDQLVSYVYLCNTDNLQNKQPATIKSRRSMMMRLMFTQHHPILKLHIPEMKIIINHIPPLEITTTRTFPRRCKKRIPIQIHPILFNHVIKRQCLNQLLYL
mmetsp:Transcript_23520/g.34834  ORF Transcript_23520/g.34834 Transcript_23520/m.34834 type:complete len:130 (-) Transcript_23520:931-1320(-)